MSKIAKGIGKGIKKVFKKVGKVFKKVVTSKIFWVVVAVVLIAYTAGAFTPAVTSAAPAATSATAAASTTTATATATASTTAATTAAGTTTLAPITVAPQALAGGGMSAGVGTTGVTGATTAATTASTLAPVTTATPTVVTSASTLAPVTTATPAWVAPQGGVIGALKGGLGSVATWVGDNPWPVALGMQAGGAALQANAATDMAEDERKRREGNYNIQDMSPAYNLAPSAKPNVSQQVDVGQQTVASTQVNAPRRAESAKMGRSPRRSGDRNRRALIDSKMQSGLDNGMNNDKSKGVA